MSKNTTTLLLLSFFMAFAVQLVCALPSMPYGFNYPMPYRPMALKSRCYSCPDLRKGIRMAEEDIIFHTVRLDPIDQKWAGDLLGIETGYKNPWSPEQVYQLSFGGIKGFEKHIFASVSRNMVLFDKIDKIGTNTKLHSINRPLYTLHRDGDYVVLEKKHRRAWFFKSEDFGKTWRLSKMGFADHPGRYTTLIYTAGKITEIKYPGGGIVSINYRLNVPLEILTPAKKLIQISRDSGRYIKSVKIYATKDGKRKGKPLRAYEYINNSKGGFVKFKNEYSETYSVMREKREENGTTLYVKAIRTDKTGHFIFRRHFAYSKVRWEIEDGVGAPGQSVEDAFVKSFRMLKKQKIQLKAVQVAMNRQAPQKKRTFDKDLLKEKLDPIGRKVAIKHDAAGNITQVKFPGGLIKHFEFDAKGNLVKQKLTDGRIETFVFGKFKRPQKLTLGDGSEVEYFYNKFADVLKVVHKRGVDEFQVDTLGRIKKHTRKNKTADFKFSPSGRLVEKTVKYNGKKKVETFAYTYDHFGKLIKITYGDDSTETFKFKQSQLIEHVNRSQKKQKYKYNNQGLLTFRRDFKDTVYQYKYDDYGRMIQESINLSDGKKAKATKKEYNDLDQLVSIVEAGKKTSYKYDKAGRIYSTQYADGSLTLHAFDERNRIIKVRGNHQEELDYTYNEKGQAIEHPAKGDLKAVLASIPVHAPPPQAKAVAGDKVAGKNYDGSGREGVRRVRERHRKNAIKKRIKAASKVNERVAGNPEQGGVILLRLEEDAQLTDLEKRFIIFGSSDCEDCTWTKFEWLPDFIKKIPEKQAYFIDTQTNNGLDWLIGLEKTIKPKAKGGTLPVVYFRGQLFYGARAIRAISAYEKPYRAL